MELTREVFEGRTTFILGSEKHAGKTTLLNYLLSVARSGTRSPAYLTVGVDGEGEDLLTGRPKPYIRAERDDWLVTTENALRRSTVLIERYAVFPFRTVLGPLVLGKIVRGGPVELVGPETNTQLSEVLEAFSSLAPECPVVVNGAVNRVTQVAAASGSAYLFVETVRPANLARAVAEIERLFLLDNVAQVDGELERDLTTVAISGALTESKVQGLDDSCQTVVVDDFSRVMIGHSSLRGLLKRRELRFRNMHAMLGVVVNLKDVTRQDFVGSLSSPSYAGRIVFNPYQDTGGTRAHASP